MDNFERLNLSVTPIKDNKTPAFAWNDPDNWCDWEEREDIFPGYNEWYVIPGGKRSYEEDGVEWSYYVLDIDRGHQDGDEKQFFKAMQAIKEWKLPPTLVVQTKHGGYHFYYKCLTFCRPGKNLGSMMFNGEQVPIELKINTGWVAPNGIDRKIVRDLPVAILSVERGTPFGDAVNGMSNRKFTKRVSPENPNFDISRFYPVKQAEPGERHNILISTMVWLKEQGCPRDLAIQWGEDFYAENGRIAQRNEIENAWDWDGSNTEPPEKKIRPLLKEEDLILKIFPGAETLTGQEALDARNAFWI